MMKRLTHRVAGAFPGNLAYRLDRSPVCTFTFDDCPRSAFQSAGAMLEELGSGGTYFISCSMFSRDSGDGMLLERDLETLIAHGHEVGCHTHHHHSVIGRSYSELLDDITANSERIRNACGTDSPVTFAY